MRSTGLILLVIVGLLVASSAAWAEEGEAPAETPPAGEPPPPESSEPAPRPRPPQADDDEQPTVRASAPASTIPGRAIAIGAGWVLPTDVTIPNAASVRLRLNGGLTFEALLRASWEGTTIKNQPDIGPGTTDGTGIFELRFEAIARKPMATAGRFQFIFLIGAGAGYTSTVDDPDGSDNSTTDTITTAFATWGFGIDWFFLPRWSLSLTAANPILELTRVHDDGLFNDQTITNFEVGAIYDPRISVFVHLYY